MLAFFLALAAMAGACGCTASGSASGESKAASAQSESLSSTGVQSGSSSSASAVETPGAISQPALSQAELAASMEGGKLDFARLAKLMGADEAIKLLMKARTNPDVLWIAAHPDSLSANGETVQGKLLRLAADEDAAVDYVRHFGERFLDMEEGVSSGIAIPEGAGSYPKVAIGNPNVPHLYQWDPAWGYAEYSSSAFGVSACGPTAFAMAYQGVTGDDSFSPYDAGVLSWQLGFMSESEGTFMGYLYAASQNFGLNCEELPTEAAAVRDALERGCVVVANVGHGYFSRFSGHYLVLPGLDKQGKVVIHDPYSVVNSLKPWDLGFIFGETKKLYAISRPAPATEPPVPFLE